MKLKRVPLFAFLLLFNVINLTGLHAQRVTQQNPYNYSFRAVSMGSLNRAMAVGDSGYVWRNDTALTTLSWNKSTPSGFGSSITLYAVAYAADTLHAVIGGTQGSLAVSSDGGNTWNHISGYTATIRALTWNKQGVLIGVGDGGLIIRSTDQGQTWKTTPSPTTAQLNAISFGTPADAVAVGNDTTILQTSDSGQTWARLLFPAAYADSLRNLQNSTTVIPNFTCVAMGGSDSVWVGMQAPLAITLLYRGGADLTASQGGFFSFSHDYSGPMTGLCYTGVPGQAIVVGSTLNDRIPYSTIPGGMGLQGAYLIGDADGGVDPVPARYQCIAFWKQDTTLAVVWLGDQGTAAHYSWTPASGNSLQTFNGFSGIFIGTHFGEDILGVDILSNGYGFAVGTECDFIRTSDGGRSWVYVQPQPIVNRLDSAINTVYTLDSSRAIVIGWDGLIFEYDSSGSHFLTSNTEERLHGIAFPSKDTGIIVGDYGTILQSTDRGATWQNINTPAFVYLRSVAFANDLDGVAVGDAGTILQTSDEGTTWNNINSIVTDAAPNIEKVQAFPGGTFLAQAGGANDTLQLIRSTDFGQNWASVNLPNGANYGHGMSFYSTQIGIVAVRYTVSTPVPDTVWFAYTTDGGATWPQFSIPMWAYNQVFFHWLSDHEVIIYGIWGFIEDVTIGENGVIATRMDNTSPLQVYPNPSSGNFRVDYTTKTNGPVQIELWDEAGKKIEMLFSGDEAMGAHEHTLDPSKSASSSILHGAYFIRVTHDGVTSTAPVSVE